MITHLSAFAFCIGVMLVCWVIAARILPALLDRMDAWEAEYLAGELAMKVAHQERLLCVLPSSTRIEMATGGDGAGAVLCKCPYCGIVSREPERCASCGAPRA